MFTQDLHCITVWGNVLFFFKCETTRQECTKYVARGNGNWQTDIVSELPGVFLGLWFSSYHFSKRLGCTVLQVDCLCISLSLFYFPVPPHVLCGLRGPPSWAWQECKRFLTLGRPWGAVTLSRWCVSGDRGGCSARRGLKPKFYKSPQIMVTAGIFPFKENSHGRAGNRTRDLMVSSERLWPLDHEAGHCKINTTDDF